jgi:hypothetical protein
MRDFFHGWRRKVGCALLLVAISLCILWARSQLVEDTVSIPTRGRSDLLTSLEGRLIWEASARKSKDSLAWKSQTAKYDWLSPWVTNGLLPRYEFAGLEYGGHNLAGGAGNYRWVVVPYAWLVLPCTLLSAYLILVRPRVIKATQPPI